MSKRSFIPVTAGQVIQWVKDATTSPHRQRPRRQSPHDAHVRDFCDLINLVGEERSKGGDKIDTTTAKKYTTAINDIQKGLLAIENGLVALDIINSRKERQSWPVPNPRNHDRPNAALIYSVMIVSDRMRYPTSKWDRGLVYPIRDSETKIMSGLYNLASSIPGQRLKLGDPPGRGTPFRSPWHFYTELLAGSAYQLLAGLGYSRLSKTNPEGSLIKLLCAALSAIEGQELLPETVAQFLKRIPEPGQN